MMRCKFKITEFDKETGRVKAEPVVSGSAENESFFKFTPWGSFEVGTVNEKALEGMEVGREIYLDVSLA